MPLSPFEKNALFQVVCDHIAANYTSLAINVSYTYLLDSPFHLVFL